MKNPITLFCRWWLHDEIIAYHERFDRIINDQQIFNTYYMETNQTLTNRIHETERLLQRWRFLSRSLCDMGAGLQSKPLDSIIRDTKQYLEEHSQ